MTISPKMKAQALRFVRLFAAAFLSQLVVINTGLAKETIIAAAIGAAEVAYRAFVPATGGDPVPPTP